ncbi:hypothetical protein [Marinimicrobium koreense]|uniref:hypothetical protein n=1 Tax=Marinimicrobium koreense TaxID=306545 RepID=UPI000F4C8D60|nr:hypothetical protein [Marinimicrobium koreense]
MEERLKAIQILRKSFQRVDSMKQKTRDNNVELSALRWLERNQHSNDANNTLKDYLTWMRDPDNAQAYEKALHVLSLVNFLSETKQINEISEETNKRVSIEGRCKDHNSQNRKLDHET